MSRQDLPKVDCGNFSVYFDNKGYIQKVVFQKEPYEPSVKYSLYEIDGENADVSAFSTGAGELSLELATKKASGRLTISHGKEMKIRFVPDKKDTAKNASLVLPFPVETEFHLTEDFNLGRKIDSDMPVGEHYSANLGYNFFLANCKGMWLRFMVKQPNAFQSRRSASVHISRHPEIFIVTFTWRTEHDACVAVFSSMDKAVEDFETWLEKDVGVKKLRDRPDVPDWVHNVRLVLIIDMMRSNWEIAHDYDDVTNLAKELKEIGCSKDTLLYVPGWNGAYDSTYPTYKPHPELGGEQKFKKMMDTIHKNGFRVLIHTNAWGVDPYHPNIDKYLKYVLKDRNGDYAGFQTGTLTKWGIMAPPSRLLKFRTDKLPLSIPGKAKSFTFETVDIPDKCEALVSVGGIKVGDARVKFTIDRRSMTTPSGWFKDHDEYALPFPFLLNPGRNKAHVEVLSDTKPDWSEAWYKIRTCLIPTNPYSTWTYPILFADTTDPEWIKTYVDEVAATVRKYNIDAIHVDATEYEWNKPTYIVFKEKLPDIPMAAEGFGTLSALGYWTFAQGVGQSLLGYLDVMRGTTQQGSLTDRTDLEELYKWLNKSSPVTNFVKDYIYIYPHLCAADAFVPIGKVCNTFPTRSSPRCTRQLWKVLRDAKRLNCIPALRLNYRKYGLDEESKKAIKEIAALDKT